LVPGSEGGSRPSPCENSNGRAAVDEFELVLAVFGQYGSAAAAMIEFVLIIG
jgi:hypothetical protein